MPYSHVPINQSCKHKHINWCQRFAHNYTPLTQLVRFTFVYILEMSLPKFLALVNLIVQFPYIIPTFEA